MTMWEMHASCMKFFGIGGAASLCQDCGVCESLCPQHLPIRKYLRDVTDLLGS